MIKRIVICMGVMSSVLLGLADTEIKASPGAFLVIWNGRDMSTSALATVVDKGNQFSIKNAMQDPAVSKIRSVTCRWSGILNITDPGVYIFNVVHNARHSKSSVSVKINGISVANGSGGGSSSKNVTLPGAVAIEITMSVDNFNRSFSKDSVLIRYKKEGDIDYVTISPKVLYHVVK